MQKSKKQTLMKRIITLITLVLFTGLLLPSCGVTIQKRQHNKGYYVSTNNRIPAAKDNKREIRPETTQSTATAQVPEEQPQARTESEQVLAETVVNRSTAEERTMTSQEAPAVLTTDATTPATRPATLQHTEKTSFAQKVEKMAERTPLAKKLNTQKMKSSARGSSEGLSLFWIVILILLILWALGVIGGGWGLGGLIYILLVLALILLILWLLRVI
jgi:cobalamin biosynthesis Mg chelatase CobN